MPQVFWFHMRVDGILEHVVVPNKLIDSLEMYVGGEVRPIPLIERFDGDYVLYSALDEINENATKLAGEVRGSAVVMKFGTHPPYEEEGIKKMEINRFVAFLNDKLEDSN